MSGIPQNWENIDVHEIVKNRSPEFINRCVLHNFLRSTTLVFMEKVGFLGHGPKSFQNWSKNVRKKVENWSGGPRGCPGGALGPLRPFGGPLFFRGPGLPCSFRLPSSISHQYLAQMVGIQALSYDMVTIYPTINQCH